MKFLIIDGNSILNRAFYGIKNLSNKSGQPTNAIYGFLNIFLKLLDEVNPTYVAVAFDVKAPTFRVKQYSEYKSTRKPTPDDLISQIPIIKKILMLMGYCTIEQPGFEADDILGTLSKIAELNNNIECVIATGDKDSLQLTNDNITVKIMSTKFGSPVTTNYSKNTIIEKYNVTPSELIDVKALMGDASDNIPGVTGIGEKTAFSLISKYHNIENIYNNITTIPEKPTLKNKLLASKDMAFLSKDLATICTCVPINTDIKKYEISAINKEELLKILADLEMFSIIKRLNLNSEKILNNHFIEPKLTFNNLLNINDIIFNLEQSENKNIYILIEQNINYIIMVNDKIFISSNENNLFKALLNYCSQNNKLNIYINNSKQFHKKMLLNFKTTLPVKFDSELAGYLLDPNSSDYNVDKLINFYCKTVTTNNIEDKIISFAKLCNIMISKIESNNLSFLLNNVELPLSQVLADIELTGFKINQKGLILFGEKLDESIEILKNNIYASANCEFNINSPKQLANILFNELKLPTGKKTKTGYSTNADVLEFLKDKHPIINKILEYRLLTKLKTTYVDGLLKEVKIDNRIHSIFNQTETRTGRISSEQPNLQNIPIKTELGKNLRSYFVAEEGHKLIDGDYSQIELRILADISNDTNMIEAFKNNQDIHTKTASEVFNVPICDVTSQMRSFSKAVNFGIIYGISSFSLANDIGISISEAKEYIDSYFKKFSGVKKYLDNVVDDATKNGFVTTLFGRKRNIPELLSKNKNLKALGERIAKNTPIQGTAADIIKMAMVNVYNKLKLENLKSKIILQVHDELIIEAPINEVEQVKKILENEMQKVTKLKVPLKVDINVGDKRIESH